jgi:hypothetical protein
MMMKTWQIISFDADGSRSNELPFVSLFHSGNPDGLIYLLEKPFVFAEGAIPLKSVSSFLRLYAMQRGSEHLNNRGNVLLQRTLKSTSNLKEAV